MRMAARLAGRMSTDTAALAEFIEGVELLGLAELIKPDAEAATEH